MIIELVVAMLACSRIGAVHSIIFGGYSSDSLASRIIDGGAKVLVTTDGVYRGKKLINLIDVANKAMEETAKKGHPIETNIVVSHLPRLNGYSNDKKNDNVRQKTKFL